MPDKDDKTPVKAGDSGFSAKPAGQKTPAEWARELKIKPHYLAGAAKYAGWAADQKISKSDFERKLNEWLKRPVGARR
ncbi:MAG: hypothetical protein JSU85_06510 [Candidatus Zixiibacteriota bacterium]|nr:MAG: hypothetical protein JSU85_06510 [candidate division Zixibacteria bacterium]